MTTPQYSDDVTQVFYALARKFAFDMNGYVSLCQSLKEKILNLKRSTVDSEDPEQLNAIIRCNRIIKYVSKDKSFHVIGELGRGIFGRVELVVLKEDSNSFQYTKIIVEKESLWLCDNRKYVVPLIACWIEHGYKNKPDNICLLSEYMSHGDFSSVIKQLFPLTASRQDRRNHDGLFEKRSNDFFQNHAGAEIRKLKIMLMETETGIIFGNAETHKDYMQIIVRYIYTLLKAVEYLHSKEIVHRDIKPGNILVNDQLEIKLSDLGMATPFKAIHERKLYGWMTENQLKESQFNDLFEFKDIEFQRNAFNQQRNAFGKVAEVVGTKTYLAPEYIVPDYLWEETFHHPKPNIMVKKHFPADWYSLGCVISALCNGLHPIIDVLGFYSPPGNSTEKKNVLNLIRIKPKDKNPLLYDEDNYSRISYGDKRLLEIVRGLLHPHPDKRANGSDILNSTDFLDLKSKYMRSDQPVMSYWNRYVSTKTKSKGQVFLEEFSTKPLVEYKSSINRCHQVHRISETAILPMSTTFLGPLSFSMSSPRRRYRRALKDLENKVTKVYSSESDEEDESAGQLEESMLKSEETQNYAPSTSDQNSETDSDLSTNDEDDPSDSAEGKKKKARREDDGKKKGEEDDENISKVEDKYEDKGEREEKKNEEEKRDKIKEEERSNKEKEETEGEVQKKENEENDVKKETMENEHKEAEEEVENQEEEKEEEGEEKGEEEEKEEGGEEEEEDEEDEEEKRENTLEEQNEEGKQKEEEGGEKEKFEEQIKLDENDEGKKGEIEKTEEDKDREKEEKRREGARQDLKVQFEEMERTDEEDEEEEKESTKESDKAKKRKRNEELAEEKLLKSEDVDISDEFRRKMRKQSCMESCHPCTRFSWHEAPAAVSNNQLETGFVVPTTSGAQMSSQLHQNPPESPDVESRNPDPETAQNLPADGEKETRYVRIAVPIPNVSVKDQRIQISVPTSSRSDESRDIHISVPMEIDYLPSEVKSSQESKEAELQTTRRSKDLLKKESNSFLNSQLESFEIDASSDDEVIGMDSPPDSDENEEEVPPKSKIRKKKSVNEKSD